MTTTKKTSSLTTQTKKLLKEIETHTDNTLKLIEPKFSKKREYKNAYFLYNYSSYNIPNRILMFSKDTPNDTLLTSIATSGNIAYKNKTAIKTVYEQTSKTLQQEIIRAIPENLIDRMRNSPTINEEVQKLLEAKVNTLLGNLDDVVADINKMYEDESDKELLTALHKIKPSGLTGHMYIAAAVARPTILEMLKKPSNKIPVLAYITGRLHSISPSSYNKDNIIKHPGQIIQAVKDTYLIENKHWRTFLKMTPSVLNHDNDYISVLLHIGSPKPTATISNLMRKTRLPEIMQGIHNDVHRIKADESLNEENKNTQLKTLQQNYEAVCALPAVLKDMKINDFQNFEYEMRDTVDYLVARKRETGSYPHHYTWNAYTRRTRAWHYQVQREQAIRNAGNILYEWNTLIPQCDIDDYTVTPLTDNAALVAEGKSMHHCVGGYWRTAVNNDYRIFHIEHKENPQDVGTLCLTPDNRAAGNLSLNQLRSKYNGNVTPELQRVGNKVLIRYRNMLKRTDTRLHVWNKSTDTITNEVLKIVGFPDEDVTKQSEEIDLELLDQE